MSAISNHNYITPIPPIDGSSEQVSSEKKCLLGWRVAAVSIGLLASGVILAFRSITSSNESWVEVDEYQTGLITPTTSLTQDIALMVSGGVMPFFGLLGASFNALRGEKNGPAELFSETKERELLTEALMTMDTEKVKVLVKRNYEAGRIDKALTFISFIFRTDDRDDLCEELARKSFNAGRFDEALKFIELISTEWKRDRRLGKCVDRSIDIGRFNEAANFIQLISKQSERDSRLNKLLKKSIEAGLFDEAANFIRLISSERDCDDLILELAKKSFDARGFDETVKFVELFVPKKESEERYRMLTLIYKKLIDHSFEAKLFDETVKFIKLMRPWEREEGIYIELADKCFHAGYFEALLQFILRINFPKKMGDLSLKYAIDHCHQYRLGEAGKLLKILPESYGEIFLRDANEFQYSCFKACAREGSTVNSDESLEAAYQKYLELIHFVPNPSLRTRLHLEWKDVRAPDLIPDCMDLQNCPKIDLTWVPSKAIEAVTFFPANEEISKFIEWGRFSEEGKPRRSSRNTDFEMLRFRKDDPRKKALFVAAAAVTDHNNAMHPFFDERLLRVLDSKYDLKYQVISKEETLCKAIQSAIKTGELVRVYIGAHGLPKLMELGVRNDEILNISSNFSSCFSGVSPDLVIGLRGCLTGAKTSDGMDNLAQTMADQTKRKVIAATEVVFSVSLRVEGFTLMVGPHYTFSDSEEFFHPSESDPSKNIFVTFHPRNDVVA